VFTLILFELLAFVQAKNASKLGQTLIFALDKKWAFTLVVRFLGPNEMGVLLPIDLRKSSENCQAWSANM